MAKDGIKWISKRCPVCGKSFDYIEGSYEPNTCNNLDCIRKWLHDPKYRMERRYGQNTGIAT
jgi:hypothetical protein